ncbi:MAG: hypothetical protein GF331_16795 [Chitinivibrionales bacterium]|nr:hypothetical protein [Chitinivibrionales bacterium]
MDARRAVLQALAGLLLNAVCGFGATYYVSSLGSDSADGTTYETSWRTLDHGMAHTWYNDTLVLSADTFPADDILIQRHLTIIGADSVSTVISGRDSSRMFSIDYLTRVTITNVSFENGCPRDTNNDGEDGGAIYSRGILTLRGCVFRGNRATSGLSRGGGAGTGGSGGAIFSTGELSMTKCRIEQNSAGAGGSNAIGAPGGAGGGICSHGTLTMDSCIIRQNYAGTGGS